MESTRRGQVLQSDIRTRRLAGHSSNAALSEFGGGGNGFGRPRTKDLRLVGEGIGVAIQYPCFAC